jgi:hypothetical protein
LFTRACRDPKQRRPQNDQYALIAEHTPTSIHDGKLRTSNAIRMESTSRPIVALLFRPIIALPLRREPDVFCLRARLQPCRRFLSQQGASAPEVPLLHKRPDNDVHPIDTHDKIDQDTNQSGASRTAPFNPAVFRPKSKAKVSPSETLRNKPREGEAP